MKRTPDELIVDYRAELARLHKAVDDITYAHGWFTVVEGSPRWPIVRKYRRVQFETMLATLRERT